MIAEKTVFITGTDTGVGKSIFTSLLSLFYLNKGKKVAIAKPLQTGITKDTDYLSFLTENKVPIFNTYSFKLGAAPLVSAKAEDKRIDINKIVSDLKNLENDFEFLIIEGVGGISVPLKENYLLSDLMTELNYPVIIVARATLGTINHTVLTIEFAKQKKLNVLGFVVSGYNENSNDIVVKTAPSVISEITGVECLLKIPMLENINYNTINKTASLLFKV